MLSKLERPSDLELVADSVSVTIAPEPIVDVVSFDESQLARHILLSSISMGRRF